MTASELLALLGRAWARLLIYPGGLSAFGLTWLLTLLPRPEPRTTQRVPDQELERLPGSPFLVLSSIAMPWLGVALLPLPLATTLPRQTDLIVILALLEWPRLLAITGELRSPAEPVRAAGARRLAATLNGYPPLILATLALAQAGGSLEVAALVRAPGELASASAGVLHWLGAVAWALALPPALGVGPFAAWPGSAPPRHGGSGEKGAAPPLLRALRATMTQCFGAGAIQVGLRLRALGLVALAALPWSGEQEGSTALLRTLAAACVVAALLWGYSRLTSGQPARRWARAYMVFNAALLLALLWAAYAALQRRIS